MKKLMMFSVLFLFTLSFSSAQVDCTFEYSSTVEIISNFEQINSKLSACNVLIPEDFSFALNDKNILFSVAIDSSTLEMRQFYISTGEGRILSINSGVPQEYSYSVLVGEDALDSILQSEDMVGTFFTYLDKGNVAVDPQGFMATMTWFFAKLFF